MNIETIREYVLRKESVTEGFPFGDSVIVYKVNAKVFLLLPLDSVPLQFNVKCDPEIALELREEYPDAVLPGFHMNKKHWNTIIVDGTLSSKQLFGFLDHSYELVSGGKKKR
ncbi:MAG: MmcQ/YjbR family DNA-binding protein [Bacteroidota bacterium]|nr:MmcQ/YjbR family DNA-binding protein [Ferruginibacter sp.]